MNFFRDNTANLLTLLNLFCGATGAIHLVKDNYEVTAICLMGSLILDFLDGFVARALKSASPLGVQLDSLADMVSFGLIPGLSLWQALQIKGISVGNIDLSYVGLIVTLFSCLRLAIFNLDTDQGYSFKGLNTPSNTLLLFGLYYGYRKTGLYNELMSSPIFLIILTVVSSWLLVCPFRMIALKFKSLAWRDNIEKIVFVGGSLVILAVGGILWVPIVILWYMLVSFFFWKRL